MDHQDDKATAEIRARLDRIESQLSKINSLLFPPDESNQQRTAPTRIASPGQLRRAPLPPAPAAPVYLTPSPAKSHAPRQFLSDTSLESAIGTRWIGRIGMVAIIFAVAFFLKYSFDNRLIGETGRIILGVLSGCAFIGGGEYFQKKKGWHLYGQILTGGGLAILYFSIYAAFAFYHLIPQFMAFLVMIAITTTGMTLSIRYSSLVIATMGILGGFLTPVMLSTGENRPVTLFSYILLLDAAVLTVAYLKQWRFLALLAMACSALLYAGWHMTFYTAEQQPLALAVSLLYFMMFNIFVFIRKGDEAGLDRIENQVIIVVSAIVVSLSFFAQNEGRNDWYLKTFLLAMAFAEVAASSLLLRLRPGKRLVAFGYLALSIAFNIMAVFAIFEGRWLSAVIAAEMVLFAYLGCRLDRIALRLVAYLLGVIAALLFFNDITYLPGPFDGYRLILNERFFHCSLIIAAFYGLAYLLSKSRLDPAGQENFALPAVVVLTQVLSVILLSREFYDFSLMSPSSGPRVFQQHGYMGGLSLSLVWILYAFALIAVGLVKKIRLLRLLGIALAGMAIIKVFLFDLSTLATLYRIVSFVVLGVALLLLSYFYNRFRNTIFGDNKDE